MAKFFQVWNKGDSMLSSGIHFGFGVQHTMMRLGKCLLPFGLFIITVTTGCGDNGGRIPVTGLITFDGKPLESGNITFGGDKGAAGTSEIVNGKFSLNETGNEEGVLPGKYSVLISSWVEERGSVRENGSFSPGITRIPLIYLEPEKSGITAEVKTDQKNYFTFDLKSDAEKAKKTSPEKDAGGSSIPR